MITCHVHEDVFDYMDKVGPTPEGDFLVFVDGVGRLRFRFVPPLNREEVVGDDESPFPLHP